eukprot:1187664-Prorocentrum_minimum.AAC.3
MRGTHVQNASDNVVRGSGGGIHAYLVLGVLPGEGVVVRSDRARFARRKEGPPGGGEADLGHHAARVKLFRHLEARALRNKNRRRFSSGWILGGFRVILGAFWVDSWSVLGRHAARVELLELAVLIRWYLGPNQVELSSR